MFLFPFSIQFLTTVLPFCRKQLYAISRKVHLLLRLQTALHRTSSNQKTVTSGQFI